MCPTMIYLTLLSMASYYGRLQTHWVLRLIQECNSCTPRRWGHPRAPKTRKNPQRISPESGLPALLVTRAGSPLHWSSPMPLACIPARPSLLIMIPSESPCLTHVSQLGPPTMQPCAIIPCSPASHTPFTCIFLYIYIFFIFFPEAFLVQSWHPLLA